MVIRGQFCYDNFSLILTRPSVINNCELFWLIYFFAIGILTRTAIGTVFLKLIKKFYHLSNPLIENRLPYKDSRERLVHAENYRRGSYWRRNCKNPEAVIKIFKITRRYFKLTLRRPKKHGLTRSMCQIWHKRSSRGHISSKFSRKFPQVLKTPKKYLSTSKLLTQKLFLTLKKKWNKISFFSLLILLDFPINL